MIYKVILSDQAKEQFRQIIDYLLLELQSEQAAKSVMKDMDDTIERLSRVAGSLKLCDDSDLRALGYRMIRFKRHRYFMLYKIVEEQVHVYGIYHELQDYEGIMK